ncbi:DUF2442 domain-containing protein [Granulicella sp. 5B5]|uniref:DUF2442 domain-containing protein n=1 Tax=Granulicella sp. 5B5 TaxID=1617967 RepID=UPI0015F50748|nr:DUF2442 domain-containing protein [Granulicella sp. 5B5]
MVETTDEELAAALERMRQEPEEPHIVEADYQRDLELFILKLSDGRRLVLPRENLQGVADATQEQAADFNIQAPGGPMGTRIWWPQLDDGMSVEGLLEGRTGNEKWMAKIQRRDAAA